MKNKVIALLFFLILMVVLSSIYFIKHFFDQVAPYKKSGIVLNGHMEASPFVWKGAIYYLVTDRETTTDVSRLQIIRFSDKHIVSSFAEGYGLASAYVDNGTLVVIGTKGWTGSAGNISVFLSTNLTSFMGPIIIKKGSAKQKLFNTSAITIGGEKIVAYEVDERGLTPFSVRFMKSHDGTTYSDVGSIFSPETYAACPTIRSIDGYYYLWYLVENKNIYETKIARSNDLLNWEISPFPFLRPGYNEDINTSDIDFVSHDGKTYIIYAISDQKSYSKLTYATFDGDMETMVKYYFGCHYFLYTRLEQLDWLDTISQLSKFINNSVFLGFI